MKTDDDLVKSSIYSATETVDKALNGLPMREAWVMTTAMFIRCVRHMIALSGLQKAMLVIAEAILSAPGIESEMKAESKSVDGSMIDGDDFKEPKH